MCSIFGCNEMSYEQELAQSRSPITVWMMEEELVANELKGSRNSGGIGCGELTFWIHFEAMMWKRQVEMGRTALRFPVGSWHVITG